MIATIAMLIATAAPQAESCVSIPKGASVAQSEARDDGWYIKNEPMVFDGKGYSKYGLPRVLRKGDVVLFTSFKGAALYIEPGTTGNEVFYLLTNLAACEFQPYVKDK